MGWHDCNLRQTLGCLLPVQNVSEIHRWWHDDVIYWEVIKTSWGSGTCGVISYSLPHAKHVVMWIKWKAFRETVKFGTRTLHLLTNTPWSCNWWILSVLGKHVNSVYFWKGGEVFVTGNTSRLAQKIYHNSQTLVSSRVICTGLPGLSKKKKKNSSSNTVQLKNHNKRS